MTKEQDEPTGKRSKKGQNGPKRSNKPEPLKAQVIGRHVAGDSNREIARELDIDRKTVAGILEEADMDAVLVECGYTNTAIVKNHLEPLLGATRSSMYGKDIAGATRLGALRLIDRWKGLSAKAQARVHARVEDARVKNGPATHTVCLVVADERRAARLAGLLSAGGPVDVRVGMDEKLDQNVG